MVRGTLVVTFVAGAVATDPLATPDLTGYDPVTLLCAHGQNADGSKRIQGWCRDWVGCIKQKSVATMSESAVKKAWAPAECKEYCGVWPVTAPAEGSKKGASFLQTGAEPEAAAAKSSEKRCLERCGNFQKSLSSCVTTILYEPGKVRNMGLPEKDAPKAPDKCTKKDTRCLPDLEIRSQKCLIHKTKSKLSSGKHTIPGDCAMVEMDLDFCKNCPQLTVTHQTQYHSFVGGCMDQLNAYWQATHPSSKQGAIPGATGCTVHA